MSETATLIALLQAQLEDQRQQRLEDQRRWEEQQRQQQEQQQKQLDFQERRWEEQQQQHKAEMASLLTLVSGRTQHSASDDEDEDKAAPHVLVAPPQSAAIPPFAAFDSTTELWPDYWSRFCTFLAANAVPKQRHAQVFLTNQSAAVYKQLSNLAAQQSPKKDINELTMDEIVNFMKEQFDPKLFIVRERFKFWSDMQRRPG